MEELPVAGHDPDVGEDLFQPNGLDGATGRYLAPGVPPSVLSALAQGEEVDPVEAQELQWWYELHSEKTFGVAQGIDPCRLEEAGWGLIASPDLDPKILTALKPLRELRREQATAGGNDDFYQEFVGDRGCRKGESKRDFLGRFGVGAGPANPAAGVPYYLLIVGTPDEIPFSFQYQLDVAYAVGRVCFDTVKEYRAYAKAVVSAEARSHGAFTPRISLWGPTNPDDAATKLSTDQLVVPLAEQLSTQRPKWLADTVIGEEATKGRLLDLLTADEAPDVLFTASHGVGFPRGDKRQLSSNGALVCQEWTGPKSWKGALTEDLFVSGEDIDKAAAVHPSVVFSFACYGAGTPQMDDFTRRVFSKPVDIAERAFVARLPQRLLTHKTRGPLAFVGHVERAWGCSFSLKGKPQLEVFRSTLANLLDGYPVGAAMEHFDQKYAEISSDLTSEIDNIRNSGGIPDDFELASLWTANNDARNYTIVGDPAVRLGQRGDAQ